MSKGRPRPSAAAPSPPDVPAGPDHGTALRVVLESQQRVLELLTDAVRSAPGVRPLNIGQATAHLGRARLALGHFTRGSS